MTRPHMTRLTIPTTPGYLIKSITFTVASASEPGRTYEVGVNPLTGRPQSCTCPARGTCWHMKFVASGAAGQKPRVRMMPCPADAPAAPVTTPTPTPTPTPEPEPAPAPDRGFSPMAGFINPNREQPRRPMTPERKAILDSLYA